MALPARHGMAWKEPELKALLLWHQNHVPLSKIAFNLKRTEYAIQCKLESLLQENQMNAPRKEDCIDALVSGTVSRKEPPFMESILFLKGRPIKDYSDQELYKLIANEEMRAQSLSKIEHKPKSLLDEINQIDANLQQLIIYLDTRDIKQ